MRRRRILELSPGAFALMVACGRAPGASPASTAGNASPAGKPDNVDDPLYYIRDGVVIIPKNAVIPSGTII